MKINIDFTLNHRFGVVEKTIFRLVLFGINDAEEISFLLSVFSNTVKSNAIIKLVNNQILFADVDSGKLFITETIYALISACSDSSYEVEVPVQLTELIVNGGLIISDVEVKTEAKILKKALISQLLPNIKLDFLCSSLDFLISNRGEINE